jgi:hypothetical protein
MAYKEQFPDYDNAAEFERVAARLRPLGFVDASFRNDACPKLWLGFAPDAQASLSVFVDFCDPELREFPDSGDTVFAVGHGAKDTSAELGDASRALVVIDLAVTFSILIRRYIAGNLPKAIELNRGYEFGCATHNFCDSNAVMLEALECTFGRDPLVGEMTDADAALINDAWSLAKFAEFSLTRASANMAQ